MGDFLAMTRPEQSPRQWQAWLQSQSGSVFGVRLQDQLVAVAALDPIETSFAGQWQTAAAVSLLALHPGMSRSQLLDTLFAKIRPWASSLGAWLILADETECGPLSGVGFVPSAPQTTLTVRPIDLALTPMVPSLRPATPEDIGPMATAFAARALACQGVVRRTPAAWTSLGSHLAPIGSVFAYVCEGDGQIEGYCIFTEQRSPDDRPELHVVEWVDTTARASAAMTGFLHRHAFRFAIVRMPLHPDRPFSQRIAARAQFSATVDARPSVLVLDTVAALQGLWPDLPVALQVTVTGANGAQVVDLGPFGAARVEPMALDATVVGELVSGATTVAQAVWAGKLQTAPAVCKMLTDFWRGRPACRLAGF